MNRFQWAILLLIAIGIVSFSWNKRLPRHMQPVNKDLLLMPTLNQAYDGLAYRHSHVAIDVEVMAKAEGDWEKVQEHHIKPLAIRHFHELKPMEIHIGSRPYEEDLEIRYTVTYDCQGTVLKVQHVVQIPSLKGLAKVELKV